jgi:hypothetical protein
LLKKSDLNSVKTSNRKVTYFFAILSTLRFSFDVTVIFKRVDDNENF